MSLRKEKMEDFLFSKRRIKLNPHIELEIDPAKLVLNQEILLKQFKNFEDEVIYFKDLITSTNSNEQMYAILRMRKLLCTDSIDNIEYISTKGVIQNLSEILFSSTSNSNNSIIYEILWCFVQLTSVKLNNNIKILASNKFFQKYEALLNHEKEQIMELTLKILGNLVIESLEIKMDLIASSLFTKIVSLINKEQKEVAVSQNLAFLITNLADQKKPFLPENTVIFSLTKVIFIQDLLMKLIEVQNYEVSRDCLWGLYHTTDTDYEQATKRLYDLGIIHRLLALYFKNINDLIIPAVRILGNIVSLDQTTTEEMIKIGLVEKVQEMLTTTTSTQVIRETAWVLSNVTAGTKSQVECVLRKPVIMSKIFSLCKHVDHSIKMEAVNVLSFACSGSDFELCLILINMKIFELFIDLLSHSLEPKLILTVLEGLENIFQQGEIMKQINQINPFAKKFEELGGIAPLNRLQQFKNAIIYETTIRIIENFFSYLIRYD